MNQLGGIGRGRSQFGPTADGAQCDEDYLLLYLAEINAFILDHFITLRNKVIAAKQAQGATNLVIAALLEANNVDNLKLVLMKQQSTAINEILSLNGAFKLMIDNHVSHPNLKDTLTLHLDDDDLNDMKEYLVDTTAGSGLTSSGQSLSIPSNIKDKIKYVNGKLGEHKIAYLNDNFTTKIHSDQGDKSVYQILVSDKMITNSDLILNQKLIKKVEPTLNTEYTTFNENNSTLTKTAWWHNNVTNTQGHEPVQQDDDNVQNFLKSAGAVQKKAIFESPDTDPSVWATEQQLSDNAVTVYTIAADGRESDVESKLGTILVTSSTEYDPNVKVHKVKVSPTNKYRYVVTGDHCTQDNSHGGNLVNSDSNCYHGQAA